MNVTKRFAFLIAIIVTSGCGKLNKTEVEKPDPTNEQFLSLSNIQNAPASIKEAGKAVVMVITHEDGRGGTAAFISRDGLLMTNNHVLGDGECPKSGCYVRLAWNLEVGEKSDYKNVFAIPKVVGSVG